MRKFAYFLMPVLLSVSTANASDRPFWAEKTSWVRGEELYVTGIASNAESLEIGRQNAFYNGLLEIQNYFAGYSVNPDLVQTQMVYEEKQPDGTFQVYRLLTIKIQTVKNGLKVNPGTPEATVEPAPEPDKLPVGRPWAFGFGVAFQGSTIGSGGGLGRPLILSLHRDLGRYAGLRAHLSGGGIGGSPQRSIAGRLGAALYLGRLALGADAGIGQFEYKTAGDTQRFFMASLGYRYFQFPTSPMGFSLEGFAGLYEGGTVSPGIQGQLLYRF